MFVLNDFKKLDIHICDCFKKQIGIFQSRTGTEIRLSDYGFINLLAYSKNIETYYMMADGYLYILVNWHGKRWFYPPLGNTDKGDYAQAIHKLYGRFAEDGLLRFTLVPEAYLPLFTEMSGYKTRTFCNADYSDYIYMNEAFLDISANPSARYDMNHFKKRFSPELVELSNTNKHICLEIIDKFWCDGRVCADCHFGCERDVIENCVNNLNELDAVGALLYGADRSSAPRADNASVALAFIVAEWLGQDIISYDFFKSKPRIRGLSKYFYEQFAKKYHPGAKYINYSEDMGIEGIRRFKSSLAPYILLHKYDVFLERLP